MATLTQDTDYFVREGAPHSDVKQLVVSTVNTVDATDTLAVDLTAYGCHASGLIGVLGFNHTTDNSVMVQEQPTTAVSSGTLTLTVPAGTDNDPRYYVIWARSQAHPS